MRVATYNVHLLPAVARPIAGHRSHSTYRAGQAFKNLADCDVVGFCEVFTKCQREKLIESIDSQFDQQIYFASGPKRSIAKGTDSGLLLFSRVPIEEQNTLAFRASSRMWRDGWKADGLATKGVLHGRLDCGERKLDCFLTHLDSLLPSIRERQLAELSQFILAHSNPESSIVLMGDFNIAGPRQGVDEIDTLEYDRMMANLSKSIGRAVLDIGVVAKQGTADAIHPDSARRIDYVFVMPPISSSESAVDGLTNSTDLYKLVEHRHMLDQTVREGSLSDHSAVVVELVLVD